MDSKLKLIFIFLLLAGLGYFGYRRIFTPTPLAINQISAPTPSPYVALTFEPNFEVKNANTTTRWGITVSLSPEFSAKTARLDIAYSQNCLTPTITAGDAFPRLVGPVGMGEGTIKATFSAGSAPVTQYGIIAYLTVSLALALIPKSSRPETKIF